ncbi:hypothetical protein PIB30_082312 [Stylosanthes scabra]|uniref:Cyclic nucleotide-binding domain-containing protein n=1 Tax=Stylosanthes scabra TaxID=79078 RepID=A0ABU6QSK9_9FABA|nr:hypothetical protein [Stylosanthes scabra]
MEFRLLKPRKWINSSIINWKIKEFNNSNLPRFTNEFYCVESGILDTILIDRNLVAYETRGEYFGMNPNLGIDNENFDREKAATRQWGKIVEDILKIVFPTYHHTEIGFQCSYAKVPKQPNNDDCGICMLKFMG